MKKLKIWKKASTSKMQHSELATELVNVRTDEVELERYDVAHEVVDDLKDM